MAEIEADSAGMAEIEADSAVGAALIELQCSAVSWGIRADSGPLEKTGAIRGIRVSLTDTCLAQGNAVTAPFVCGRDCVSGLFRSKLAAPAVAAAEYEAGAGACGVAVNSGVTGVQTAAAAACEMDRRRAGVGFKSVARCDVTMDSA
jgi:hypothetical protein